MKIKPEHTLGPWEVAHHGEWIVGRCPDIGEYVVAKTQYGHWRENARLIAAAPELLRHLENAECRMCGYAYGSPLKALDASCLCHAPRKLIAKAKGETL